MKSLTFFVSFFLLCCGQSNRGTESKPRDVNAAIAILEGGSVSKIEYYSLPASILTRSALTPDRLVANAPYRATLEDPPRANLVEIADGLASSTYTPMENPGDIRLGVEFYGASGQKILSIFFDQSGTRATINNDVFVVKGAVREILRRRIRCLAE
jgi:hypothetical protein